MQKVGFRRLFQTHGWTNPFTPSRSIHSELPSPYRAEMCFGTKPLYPIAVREFPNEYDGPTPLQVRFSEIERVQYSDKPDSFFEVIVWKDEPNKIEDDLSNMSKTYLDDFINYSENLCCLSGLLTSRQILYALKNENIIVVDGEKEIVTYTFLTDVTNHYDFTAEELAERMNEIGSLSTSRNVHLAAAWLNKAWSERNIHLKFLAFFVPIEILLHGVSPLEADQNAPSERVKRLIDAHAGEDAKALNDWVSGLTKPSLNQRFTAMAEKAALPNCESDISDFKKVNPVRNKFLHQGQFINFDSNSEPFNIHKETFIEDISRLRSIAERYVCYALSDGRAYSSNKIDSIRTKIRGVRIRKNTREPFSY